MALDPTISPGQAGHIGDHEEIATLLNEVTDPGFTIAGLITDTLAARPAAAAANADFLYLATDESKLYVSTGAAWVYVATTHEAASDPHPIYLLESLLDAKGDLIAASAADTPVRVAVGANGTFLTADSGAAGGMSWAVPGDVGGSSLQIFTTSDTWTKPTGAVLVIIECDGAGGGGGNGGATSDGGGGGGGGAFTRRVMDADDLAGTVSVTIGAGGTAAVAGGTSTFGTHLSAFGGGGGEAGGSAATQGGGGGGTGGAGANGSGASGTLGGHPRGQDTTALGDALAGRGADCISTGVSGNAEFGGGSGGGSGGGVRVGGSSLFASGGGGAGAEGGGTVGGAGGATKSYTGGGGGAAGGTAAAGGNGAARQGGGGGGYNSGGAGGAGGTGGAPGGGGGGAGAGTSNGAGGVGGRGEVRVYTILGA